MEVGKPLVSHDDATLLAPMLWGFTGGSPHKDLWRGALMFSLICAWTNGLANNRDGGDLRRHRAHYDITVILLLIRLLTEIMLFGVELIHLVTTWRHRSGSTLAQVIDCCLTAPSRSLNLCWLITSDDLEHSPGRVSQEILKISTLNIRFKITFEFENNWFKVTAVSAGAIT